MKATTVEIADAGRIAFRKYRVPPNIQRGTCQTCGKPAIEFGGFGPGKIAFIPSFNIQNQQALPLPSLHIFYHRRLADTPDSLPKLSGYFRSEFAVAGLMMKV